MEKVVVFIVLNKIEKLDELLIELKNKGFGATVINSYGMAHELAHIESDVLFGSFRKMFFSDHMDNKTLFVVTNEENIKAISEVTNRIVGNLSEENSGIIVAMPAVYVEGLKHLN